jgi:pimeloyl-ACP methyl ester carboxylesterase
MSRDGRCRRLVLVSTSPGVVMVAGDPRVLRHMITPRRYVDRDYARRIAGTIYGGAMRDHPEEAAAIISSRHNRLTSTTGYVYQLLALATWTSIPLGRRIRQPTLVLSGRDDPLIPLVNARMLSWLIPDARLHVFDDGHVALISRAEELVPIIADFLAAPG